MRKLIIVLIAALCIGGVSLFWEVISVFATAFFEIFVALLPFLDLEQVILCKVVTIVIVQLLCALGFYISSKTESRIGKIISAIADIIATMLIFIA